MQAAIILKAPNLTCEVSENNVIFADAAYKFKNQLGQKNVLAVVGDFDSLGHAPENEKVVNLNLEKNFTDGERAVRYAVENGYDELTIYGAFGGKIEHILGNIALLKIALNLGAKAKIKDGECITRLIDKSTNLSVKKGSTLSILPYGGNCVFKSSKGLYYPLNDLTLTPSDTRGISNVATENVVQLQLVSGEALVIYQN